MGLSGAKRRTKLASDPNNTAWSKSTNNFGYKILSAQGWQPGQMLGAENAAHAEHYTAANASHIRVMLREDNVGIGAQAGKGNAETFGLSTLSSIFGRLNGKSETDIEKMQTAHRDVELRSYQTRKFGHMTFVRGGLLVGDKIEDDTTVLQPPQPTKLPSTESSAKNEKNKSGKRAHDENDEDRTQKKSKKQKKTDHKDVQRTSSTDSRESSEHDDKADRATAKAAKRARKEDRQRRRDERAARKEERRKRKSTTHEDKPPDIVHKPTNDPVTSNLYDGGRHAFRSRFMQAKRLASMDSRALNEILMFKPAVT